MPCPLFYTEYRKVHSQKTMWCSAFRRLVEMAGVEPASENSFPQLSTSVAVRLEFPCQTVGRQTVCFGSPVLCDGLQSGVPVHIYR